VKRFLLFALILTLAGGWAQHRRLEILREELDQHRHSAGDLSKPGALSKSRERATDRASLAGAGMIPEILGMLGEMDKTPLDPSDPRRLHLQEMMAHLGAGAMEELLRNLDDPRRRMNAFGLFATCNPEQGFYLSLRIDQETRYIYGLEWNYHAWAYLDPKRALAWYRDAEERKDPLAVNLAIRKTAVASKSRIDPAGAIGDIRNLFSGSSKDPNDDGLRELYQPFWEFLRDDREYASLIEAIRHAQSAGGDDPQLEMFCKQLVRSLESRIGSRNYEDAAPIIDECLTPDEKCAFARINPSLNAVDGDWGRWAAWAGWKAAINAPTDELHPLRCMAVMAGSNPTAPEATWLDALPPSPLKDLALADYAEAKASGDPAMAARWLEKAPRDQRRQQIAEKIATAWQDSDAAAAQAFLEAERASH